MTAKHLLESHNQTDQALFSQPFRLTLGLAIYFSSRESGNLKR